MDPARKAKTNTASVYTYTASTNNPGKAKLCVSLNNHRPKQQCTHQTMLFLKH